MYKVNDKVVTIHDRDRRIVTIRKISKDRSRLRMNRTVSGYFWVDVGSIRHAYPPEITRGITFTEKELEAYRALEKMREVAKQIVEDKSRWSICPLCKVSTPFLYHYCDPTDDPRIASLHQGCQTCRDSFMSICLNKE